MDVGIGSVLITGGAGFIGSHLAQALATKGCRVTVLDNLTSGHLENIKDFMKDITFVEGDIRDKDLLKKITQHCDVVFHQAAVVSVTKTVDDPVGSALVNELGTLAVLDAARQNNVKRVVLASSSAVYGDDPQLPKIESMPPNPLSPYAVQKLTNELYADLYNELYGMETVCLRYFNVFGPRQDPSSPYSGVISIFMRLATEGRTAVIFGDGEQTRDFVFVGDVVQANILAATGNAAGEIFNVGTGKAISVNALWALISRMAGDEQKPTYEPARAGDVMHSLAGVTKGYDRLMFQASVPLTDGLSQTLAWYRNHLTAQ
ncbi:MAG: SDR family oxidoreductase [Desulfobacteraceae bacterium]